jgi:hypothetical protein
MVSWLKEQAQGPLQHSACARRLAWAKGPAGSDPGHSGEAGARIGPVAEAVRGLADPQVALEARRGAHEVRAAAAQLGLDPVAVISVAANIVLNNKHIPVRPRKRPSAEIVFIGVSLCIHVGLLKMVKVTNSQNQILKSSCRWRRRRPGVRSCFGLAGRRS